MDDVNALSSFWYQLDKDSPGKVWWHCPITHKAVNRALGISADEAGSVYACAPFRLHRSEEGVRVLAAYPAPAIFEEGAAWLDIETVISWNPVDDTAVVVGDPAPQIVGNLSADTNVIFASPRAFFQHWARRRAQYLTARNISRAQQWNRLAAEQDETPGVLMIGAPADIHWRPSTMPAEIKCAGVNPAIINRELLKAARVPRAVGGMT
jgi:hypothetical protein